MFRPFYIMTLKEYQWLEFFAGHGNLMKMMKAAGYKSARFDIDDSNKKPNRRSNFMDILSPSGFWILVAVTIIVINKFSMVSFGMFQLFQDWL